MTKTELQIALAAATQTDKKTAAVFLNTLSNLAYKAIKKNGEFVLPGFGKLVKQEEGSHRLQSQNAAEDQNPSQNGRQIPNRQDAQGPTSGAPTYNRTPFSHNCASIVPPKAGHLSPERPRNRDALDPPTHAVLDRSA